MRRRLDAELVRRGLADSRAQAASLIAAQRVLVGGVLAGKPARQVDASEPVVVLGEPDPYVGRGAHKLVAALDRFELDPGDLRVLDAGASTGGFTDALVQRGAREVVALDVGHGQLHERLRSDSRVVVVERTNLRHLEPRALGAFGAVVADLSFISLTTVMANLVDAAEAGAWMVLLVKPQFEAGRREVSRGRGVVSDPTVWRAALRSVATSATEHGAAVLGAMPSPLRGAEGNVEFLLHLRAGTGSDGADPDELAASAIDEVARIGDPPRSEAAVPRTGAPT